MADLIRISLAVHKETALLSAGLTGQTTGELQVQCTVVGKPADLGHIVASLSSDGRAVLESLLTTGGVPSPTLSGDPQVSERMLLEDAVTRVYKATRGTSWSTGALDLVTQAIMGER